MKHKQVKQHDYFKIKEGKIERERQCPRCGTSFLAKHKDRLTCGKCNYVEFLNIKQAK